MAASTGPILAIGAVTVVNTVVFNGKPMDWKVPIATGILAGIGALGEKVSPTATVGLAYIALAAVCLTRIQPDTPSPAESLLTWWNSGPAKQ